MLESSSFAISRLETSVELIFTAESKIVKILETQLENGQTKAGAALLEVSLLRVTNICQIVWQKNVIKF